MDINAMAIEFDYTMATTDTIITWHWIPEESLYSSPYSSPYWKQEYDIFDSLPKKLQDFLRYEAVLLWPMLYINAVLNNQQMNYGQNEAIDRVITFLKSEQQRVAEEQYPGKLEFLGSKD